MKNHRISKIKKLRKSGFRKRMKSHWGRKTLNRRRGVGRSATTHFA